MLSGYSHSSWLSDRTGLLVNVPILKKGVPEDDKYSFNQVMALDTTYFCNFGAELAVVSMLPAFFERTFSLTPTKAGLIASSFAFVNLVARPLGGYFSDKMKSRKLIMMIYMFGIACGFFGMALINARWPLYLATALTIACSMFVQGVRGCDIRHHSDDQKAYYRSNFRYGRRVR